MQITYHWIPRNGVSWIGLWVGLQERGPWYPWAPITVGPWLPLSCESPSSIQRKPSDSSNHSCIHSFDKYNHTFSSLRCFSGYWGWKSEKDVVLSLKVVHQGLDLSQFPSVAQARRLLIANDCSILTILVTHPRVLSGSSTTTIFTTLALIPPKLALVPLAAIYHL